MDIRHNIVSIYRPSSQNLKQKTNSRKLKGRSKQKCISRLRRKSFILCYHSVHTLAKMDNIVKCFAVCPFHISFYFYFIVFSCFLEKEEPKEKSLIYGLHQVFLYQTWCLLPWNDISRRIVCWVRVCKPAELQPYRSKVISSTWKPCWAGIADNQKTTFIVSRHNHNIKALVLGQDTLLPFMIPLPTQVYKCVQSNLSNTDTEGTEQSVCCIEVNCGWTLFMMNILHWILNSSLIIFYWVDPILRKTSSNRKYQVPKRKGNPKCRHGLSFLTTKHFAYPAWNPVRYY